MSCPGPGMWRTFTLVVHANVAPLALLPDYPDPGLSVQHEAVLWVPGMLSHSDVDGHGVLGPILNPKP